jgi:hypothetical protein
MIEQQISITSLDNFSAAIDNLKRTLKASLGQEVSLSAGVQEGSLTIQYDGHAQLDAIVSLLVGPDEARALFERSGLRAEKGEPSINTSEPNRRNQSATLPEAAAGRSPSTPVGLGPT